jgi:hypothetical protein
MRLVVADTGPIFYLLSSTKSTCCRSCSAQFSSRMLFTRNSHALLRRRRSVHGPISIRHGCR